MSTSAQSDTGFRRLLTAAREGDDRALATLFQEQWNALWNLAASLIDETVMPKHSASDVVQDSFIDARRAIADFRGDSPAEFQAWLRAMVNHNVQDAWRHYLDCLKRDAARELPLDSAVVDADLLSQQGTSPSGVVRHQEMQAMVARALEQLPENYQTIVRLRYWEQRTFEEIGQLMGKSSDAVRQMWYRAIDQFSQLIDED